MSASVTGQAAGARPFRLLGFTGAQGIAFLLLLAAVLGAPFLLYPVFLMKVLCFALFACAFNLLIGYVGLMSFGHAAFFGMGSYVSAYAARAWGVTPEVAMALGAVTGAVLGFLFGSLAIRRQGIYFAMITLGLAQMIYFFCVFTPSMGDKSWAVRTFETAFAWGRFTGGEDGIQQVPRGMLFGVISLRSDMAMYWLVATVFIAVFLLVHRIVHSPFGQVLKAIRENEPRATSLGYRTDDYKLIAFVLSCFIAGLAGGMKAIVFGIATLTDVNVGTSGDVVLMTLLGGMGTIFGPVAGATVIQTLEQYLAQFGSWVTVTQGFIFIVCVLAFRRGIVGEIAAKLRVSL